jgi:hypothetical protein
MPHYAYCRGNAVLADAVALAAGQTMHVEHAIEVVERDGTTAGRLPLSADPHDYLAHQAAGSMLFLRPINALIANDARSSCIRQIGGVVLASTNARTHAATGGESSGKARLPFALTVVAGNSDSFNGLPRFVPTKRGSVWLTDYSDLGSLG